MRTALTIAGSDSGGGAGLQADLKTFAAHGVYGACAVTAVTAQSTQGVFDVYALDPTLVAAQMLAVVSDMDVQAAKTGMLANAAIIEAVVETLERHVIHALVVDPVMVAKSGDRLLDERAVDTLTTLLFPKATVVTPNIPEAEVLTGLRISTTDDCRAAAHILHGYGAASVIIKGGHRPEDEICDLLYDGSRFLEFRAPRVASRDTHGTGCTFSAALAAHLAHGRTLEDAIPLVQEYLIGAIHHGPKLGKGAAGPMNHFWSRRTPVY